MSFVYLSDNLVFLNLNVNKNGKKSTALLFYFTCIHFKCFCVISTEFVLGIMIAFFFFNAIKLNLQF